MQSVYLIYTPSAKFTSFLIMFFKNFRIQLRISHFNELLCHICLINDTFPTFFVFHYIDILEESRPVVELYKLLIFGYFWAIKVKLYMIQHNK